MKIDLGNFGYQQREAVDARVDRGDPTTMARAMQGVAQTQQEQASRANQAWAKVGENAQQLGANLLEVVEEKARLDSANEVQKYRAASQKNLTDLAGLAADGKVKADDIPALAQKFNDEYKPADISGLGPMGQKRFAAAMQEVRDQYSPQYEKLTFDTHTVELSNSLEQNAATNNKEGFDHGLSPAQTAAYFDQPGVVSTANRVHGANASKWLAEKKESAYEDWLLGQVAKNQDNRAGLVNLANKLNDPNDVDTNGLGSDKKARTAMSIAGRIDSMDAKALAQRNAAINAARLAEERGAHIMAQAKEIQDQGQTLSEDFQREVINKTKGTTFEGQAMALPAREKLVQEFHSLPIEERGQLIAYGDLMNRSHRDSAGKLVDAAGNPVSMPNLSPAAMNLLNVHANGGTDPQSFQSFQVMKKAYDADRNLLHNDMITHREQSTGQVLPVPQFQLLTAKGTTTDVTNNVQAFIANADIPTRLAMRNSALKDDRSAKDTIWKGPESQQLTAIMNDPNVPDVNKRIIKQELYRAGGAAALKSVGADELDVTGAHFSVNYPHDTRGQEIQDIKSYETKTGKKVGGPTPQEVVKAMGEKFGDAIGPNDQLRLADSVAKIAGYRALSAGNDPGKVSKDDILKAAYDYVGTPVNYYGSKVVIPKTTTATNPASDFQQIDSRVQYALVGRPDADAIYARIKRGDLRLQATGDNQFTLRYPGKNGAVYTDPQTGGVVRLDWSK